MLHFPLSSPATPPFLDVTGRGSLAAGLDPMGHAFTVRNPELLPSYQYASHRHHFSLNQDLAGALMKNARKASAKLSKAYPLRRCVLSPDSDAGTHSRTGTISVHEGLPEPANIFMSSLPLYDSGSPLHSHHKFMIINTLPFDHQVEIFWRHDQGLENTSCKFDPVVQEESVQSLEVRSSRS